MKHKFLIAASFVAASAFAAEAVPTAIPGVLALDLSTAKPDSVRSVPAVVPLPQIKAVAYVDPETKAELARLYKLPKVETPFKGQTLAECIVQCADSANMPFVAPPLAEFGDRVTMRVTENPYRVLKMLAANYGFEMEFSNGAWRFYKINPTDLVIRRYALKFNDASSVAVTGGSLNAASSGSGSGSASGTGGGGAAPVVNLTGGTIKFDPLVLEKQVQAVIDMPVTGVGSTMEDVGSADSGFKADTARQGYSPAFKPVSVKGFVKYFPQNSLLVVEAARQSHARVEAFLSSLDRPERGVSITATFVTISKLNADAWGTDWSKASGVSAKVSGLVMGPFNYDKPSSTPPPANTMLSVSDMTWTFNFLRTKTTNTGISPVTVSTMNNTEVTLASNTQFPIQSANTSTVSGVGQQTAGSVSYVPVGRTVKIVPQVLDADPRIGDGKTQSVKLNFTIIMSAKVGSEMVNGSPIPIVDSKEYNYSVVVPNNMTLAIAGLRATDFTEVESKVPLLGDIPYLGYFFKSKAMKKDDSHTMAFISPHIMSPEDYEAGRVAGAEGGPDSKSAVHAAQPGNDTVTGAFEWDENRDKTLLPTIGKRPLPSPAPAPSAPAASPAVEVERVEVK